MADFLIWLTWSVALAAVLITLAYRRSDLPTATLIIGFALVVYSLFGVGWLAWKLILWVLLAGLVVLNSLNFRRERITLPLLHFYRSVVPTLSDTEREALEAGTVGWDGELFSGAPDWARLMALPAPRLTAEEQAFLDGPTEELCRMADDWQITHELADMPPKVWAFIKQHRFFAMIIPKRYGGLEFSPIAVAAVLAKLASRSAVVSSTVGVPNSLGPAELLLHYGTEEQREKYLPRLATAEEIPCFALTGPRVGSDAASLPDTGMVCKGMWQGQEIVGIRLNWDKRYITLAPVATVLGLAFKLYDPDHLIGTESDRGITAALIPVRTPGVEIGRRHLPLNIPFQNGPTRGRDVFVPLDAIIGGPERAGQGWKMLVEQLSAGRGITLPSSAMGGSKAVVYASGAYTRLRKQFNLPVCEFEGVGEALARIAGYTYIINAGMTVTSTMIARGEKPAVPSAVLKYHCTELARKIVDDAMDVHGGKGIMLGPSNYLGRGYQGVPIAVTVEGANILTRSLIIFGQGAIRCHPFVLKEMEAAKDPDFARGLRDFDRYLFAHIGYAISNAARSFVLALTNAEVSSTPMDGPTARFFQHVNRYSAAFALAADVAMLVLGGQLKRRETLSARLGDVFSSIYLASMVLKHFDNQGRQDGDLPLVEWACRTLLYQAQEQLHGFLRNFPNRIVAAMLRVCIFPRGRMYSAPPDDLGREIVALITRPTETRARLCDGIYATRQPDSPLGQLQATLEMAERLAPLEEKIRDAIRADVLTAGNVGEVTAQAVERGLITADEARQLQEFDTAVLAIISVDDFDPSELRRVAQPATLPFHDTAGAVG
jgi:acyl-CoA dehydrogenase